MAIHRQSIQRAVTLSVAAAALVVTPLLTWHLAGGTVDAATAPDRLPDLAMARPTDLRIQTTTSGARRLRLTTTIVNIGAGPFETRSSRRSTSDPTMHVTQRIYNSAGGSRVHETTEVAKYAGDGHDHWHVQNVAHYELFQLTGLGPILRSDSKVGFCFFDTNPYRLSLPGAPASKQYFQSGCGVRSSVFVKNGISVGWGDKYPWNFAWQLIDVTGLPAGDYLLKASADPGGDFLESVEKNNCNWTRLRIPKTGTSVTVLAFASGCPLPDGFATVPTGRAVVPPRSGD